MLKNQQNLSMALLVEQLDEDVALRSSALKTYPAPYELSNFDDFNFGDEAFIDAYAQAYL
jgi:hypothetical protein